MSNAQNAAEFWGAEARFVFNKYGSSRLETQGEPCRWSDLDAHDPRTDTLDRYPLTQVWYLPEETTTGDYSRMCLVGASNLRVVMAYVEEHELGEYVVEICGGYGSRGVAIRGDCTDQGLLDMYAGLADYIILDDDDHSRMGLDAEIEAWESWGRADFETALEKRFDVELDLGDDAWKIFEAARERANEYWVNESGTDMYIDIARVAAKVDRDEIVGFIIPEVECG